ncbi:DUF397 domain-containing protein [Plantactinospora sp. BB1]|uniref:DUF397 domain-containing protein n=1 Tax=Plantactinospora sp. BB1 TaxID=2071627 RepID=UPI000D16ABBE|nr:DUF397 domain-containing protein [Plantactinospora sp. BB1]AVT38945.1 DUF397 domain-containing protein [Plantactinospora sp. BB1]
MTEPTILNWRKSTRSGAEGSCVEVAVDVPGQVLVRDTKDRHGGTLALRPAAWRCFVNGLPERH